jgi:hypothetical protein
VFSRSVGFHSCGALPGGSGKARILLQDFRTKVPVSVSFVLHVSCMGTLHCTSTVEFKRGRYRITAWVESKESAEEFAGLLPGDVVLTSETNKLTICVC